ncbi:MAG TPA: hypothetical protein VEF91_00750 [Verrucomicrobiae bacterium]|nr:hypothetical protein [Verrucomicrobiae bacterium]
MANITIEYMILIPILILQIFLLPFAAGIFMSYWTTSSDTLALNDASAHISASIGQLYLFLNNPSVSTGTVTNNLNLPSYIGNYAYNGTATLASVSGSGSETVLELTLTLVGTTISTTTPVTLGQNVQWMNSTFASNTNNAGITGQKDSNDTILLSFGS